MSATTGIDSALTDRVASLVRELEQVSQARPPIEAEVQAELLRLETIAARGEALPPMSWLSPNPQFSPAVFAESLTAAWMAIAPEKVRQVAADRARRRAEGWRGLRMSTTEKERKLIKLTADLRTARAKVELRRREIEEATGEVQPRVGDDPSVWLAPPDTLAAMAGGRSR